MQSIIDYKSNNFVFKFDIQIENAVCKIRMFFRANGREYIFSASPVKKFARPSEIN